MECLESLDLGSKIKSLVVAGWAVSACEDIQMDCQVAVGYDGITCKVGYAG